MLFKIIIFILAAAMLISLFSSAFFLVRDKGKTERAQYTLRIRVSIGIYSGQLTVNSPWG
jgi:hypothetical protein